MNQKRATRLLGWLGASATMLMIAGACGPRANDINQVQPGYVKKSIFLQNSEWYYKRTIAKSETTQSYAVEGLGDWALDRVKWRVEENLLIAYKPYEAIPGNMTGEYPGQNNFEGATLAAFPITDHFDIKRGYDPGTGNETNVVSENTTDRRWFERDYMRVNWADNKIDRSIYADYSGDWFPVSYIATGNYWTNQESRPADEFASRFTADYVEVTQNALLGMDLLNCAAYVGYYFSGYEKCGFGEAKVRHSFVRIKVESDYIPRNYPDSVVKKDQSGNSIADPATGEIAREPIFNRFGYFRTEFPTFDRGYGTTESGKIYRAFNFPIWKRYKDDQGNEIPIEKRDPKPIIYYMNAEFPARWRPAIAEVSAEYDRVFKSMVSDIVGASKTPEHMYEIRDNDCNTTNVKSFVMNNSDLVYAVARAVCPSGTACDNPLDKIAVGNLTTVCASLEAASRDPVTNVPKFEWQRVGDGRYNMLVWFSNPQESGWSGLGLINPDGRTGEAISGAAYIRGHFIEIGASNVVDYIELINDEKSIDQIIYGQDIRKQVAADLKRAGAISTMKPSQAMKDLFAQRMDNLGRTKSDLLKEVDAQHQINRLKTSLGTSIEEKMISDYDVAMASRGIWKRNDPVTDELRQKASPYGKAVVTSQYSPAAMKARVGLAQSGLCFPTYDFDIHWAGLALQLKDIKDRDQRYDIVAKRLIKHVVLHELGHNVGFRHNFEGSFDALNYPDTFWQNNWGTDDEKLQSRYEEFRNTTVMEYMSSKGLFTDTLGKYDEAAIRFAYGFQVATFADSSIDQSLQGGDTLKQWRYMNDYQKIPDKLCGGSGCADITTKQNVIKNRKWVKFDPQNPPQNEVPFHFCSDEYNHMTPFCSTFDYGSNLREIFANYYTYWAHYFFFNNFLRNRLTPLAWDPSRAIIPAEQAMIYVDTVGQYLYYMNAVDPAFRNSDLGQDMLTTVATGLNFASEVMSTPEPLRMCPWPGATSPEIYIPWYYLNNCDEFAPLDSDYAIQAEAIQLPLGDARPTTIGFSEDYEDWDWTFVGSYFDKSNMLFLLGYNRPHFFRFNYDLDIRNYSISLYRLFEPELRSFYDRVTNLDGYFIEQQTALELGSYWCRDATAPGVASLGHFEPRKMIDPTSANPSLPGPSSECMQPAVVYPALLRNMPYNAMYYAYALFSSDFDSQLNMGKSIKIYAVGADDDYPSWDTLTVDQYCTLVDATTGVTYRAIHQASNIPDLGCRIIAKAKKAQDDWLGSNGSPDYHDRWRAWMERVEWARDLARLYELQRIRIPRPMR